MMHSGQYSSERSMHPFLLNHASTLHPSLCQQVRDMELSQRYEDELEDMHLQPPDMPTPTCFRSRSHSYLRAIQAGCSQDDDSASVDSDSPPPTSTTTVRTYSNSTGEYSPALVCSVTETWKTEMHIIVLLMCCSLSCPKRVHLPCLTLKQTIS